jgi:hypothetical protein
VTLGLRTEGGFVGTHDRDTQAPVPEHISARPHDLKGTRTHEFRALSDDEAARVEALYGECFGGGS